MDWQDAYATLILKDDNGDREVGNRKACRVRISRNDGELTWELDREVVVGPADKTRMAEFAVFVDGKQVWGQDVATPVWCSVVMTPNDVITERYQREKDNIRMIFD